MLLRMNFRQWHEQRVVEIESELAGNAPLVPLDRVMYRIDDADVTYRRVLEITLGAIRESLPARTPSQWEIDEASEHTESIKIGGHTYEVLVRNTRGRSGISPNMAAALRTYGSRRGRGRIHRAAEEGGVSDNSLLAALKRLGAR